MGGVLGIFRIDLRVFMGVLEYKQPSKVGIPFIVLQWLADFRNAGTWLPGLFTIRGILRFDLSTDFQKQGIN